MHEEKSFQPRDVLTSPTISLVSVMPKILKCHTYSSFSLFFVVNFIAYRIIIEDILDLLYLHIRISDVKYNCASNTSSCLIDFPMDSAKRPNQWMPKNGTSQRRSDSSAMFISIVTQFKHYLLRSFPLGDP